MGCVQSLQSKSRHSRKSHVDTNITSSNSSPSSLPSPSIMGPLVESKPPPILQTQQQQQQHEPHIHTVLVELKSETQDENDDKDTAVLKKAGRFDALHEEAHRMPELRDVKVVKGKNSMRLLEGFEMKEMEARATPQLRKVEGVDVKGSHIYHKLREFEMKDEQVRNEPKLEKTFVQRERESQAEGKG